MNENEKVLRVLGEWVGKAEDDLKVAAHLVKLGAECPTEAVCFHAQQCVEKYLKACLVWREVDFPRTHDITALIGLMPPGVRVDIAADEQRRLTAYATTVRYPGDYPRIATKEARQAVRIARRVRANVRKVLPKAALRRRKR